MKQSPKLRVAFAGTPDFALPALRAINRANNIDLVAVYTQPDRAAGRGRKIAVSPVKAFALENNIAVYQPVDFKSAQSVADFKSLKLDVLVVAAYGIIVPQVVLDSVKYPLNIHASLLPRWRGAAPIQRAIMAGDKETGVTIMRVIKQLDAGPIWMQKICTIETDDTASSVHDKLAALGAEAIIEAINLINSEPVLEKPQSEDEVTYAEKISSDQRNLDWHKSAVELSLQIRGLYPVPGAVADIGPHRCKILAAQVANRALEITDDKSKQHTAKVGAVVYTTRDVVGVQTGDGILEILTLQPPGKTPMSSRDFINGYGLNLAGSALSE